MSVTIRPSGSTENQLVIAAPLHSSKDSENDVVFLLSHKIYADSPLLELESVRVRISLTTILPVPTNPTCVLSLLLAFSAGAGALLWQPFFQPLAILRDLLVLRVQRVQIGRAHV